MNTESNLCSSDLDRILTTILAVSAPLILLPMMLYIAFKFHKFHLSEDSNNSYPKTTTAFLGITTLLHITVSLQIANHCYGIWPSAANVLKSSVALLCCLHAVLLIVLLFFRLYHVFKTSQYRLSKCTIRCCIAFSAVGVFYGAAYMYFFVTAEEGSRVRVTLYIIGAALIVVAMLSLILLYIWKLFLVERGSYLHREERSIAKLQKEPLIGLCAKYAVLAATGLLTEICFWSVGRFSSHSFLWFFLLYVNASANVLCYALGFGNANVCYERMCGRVDLCCRAMCGGLVLLSIQSGGDTTTMATIMGAMDSKRKSETETQSEVTGKTVESRVDCGEVDLPCPSPSIGIVYSDSSQQTNRDEDVEPDIDVVYSDAAASPTRPSDHSAER